MKPWIELDRAATGGLSLHRRDDELVIRVDGQELMSSRRRGSEQQLARVGCAGLSAGARVLVGGLGLGFTLRETLDTVPGDAEVVVAEVADVVVRWNREILGHLAGHPLADPRVAVVVGDVAEVMRAPGERFDAILLDVDNGPHGLVRAANDALYAPAGLAMARRALRTGGTLAVWSAQRHPEFERRLRRAGFAVTVHSARASGRRRGPVNAIYRAVDAGRTSHGPGRSTGR